MPAQCQGKGAAGYADCHSEAPDEFSATALNLSLSALGNIRTESLRAFSSAEMMNIVAKML